MKKKIIHLALYSILPITTFFIGIKLQPNQNSQILDKSDKIETGESSTKPIISHLTEKHYKTTESYQKKLTFNLTHF